MSHRSERPSPGQPTIEELQRHNTCSIDTAAIVLNIGRSTAYAAARDGSLPVIRVRNRLLVPTRRLLAMIGIEQAGAE